MEHGRMVSPQDLMNAAKEHMLESREPTTNDDWTRIINFVAANIALEVRVPATLFFATLYDCPLSKDTVSAIATFQLLDTLLGSA